MRVDGYFNASDEPAINLTLDSTSIEALIDTGFLGSLIVPRHLASDLELRFEGFEKFHTVTGQVFVAPAYTLEANWLGRRLRLPIAISTDVHEALLGSQLLKNCVLTIDYANRSVSIVR